MSIEDYPDPSTTNDAAKANMLAEILDESVSEAVEQVETQPEEAPLEETLLEETPEETEVEAQDLSDNLVDEGDSDESSEEPPPNVGQKANERFQKLANERNAEKARADALEAKLDALMSKMDRGFEIQNEALEMTRAQRQALIQQQKPQLLRKRMIEAGLDPADAFHRKHFQQAVAMEEMRTELARMRQTQQEREDQLAYQNYANAVSSNLASELDGFNVPGEVFSDLVDEAVSYGVNRQADSIVAAKAKADQLKKLLRKPASKQPKGEAKRVVEAVAGSGRTGGKAKKPARTAPKTKSFGDFIDDIFKG